MHGDAPQLHITQECVSIQVHFIGKKMLPLLSPKYFPLIWVPKYFFQIFAKIHALFGADKFSAHCCSLCFSHYFKKIKLFSASIFCTAVTYYFFAL